MADRCFSQKQAAVFRSQEPGQLPDLNLHTENAVRRVSKSDGSRFMEQSAAMSEKVSERRLIEACQQDDREAFRLLFEAHKDRVYSIAFHFSRNETAARDITQQVFLKLFSTIRQF